MKRYARIDDDLVMEIIAADSVNGKYHESLFFVEIPSDMTDFVIEGWKYESVNNSFTKSEPNPAPIIAPELTVEEYLIDLDFRLSNIELGL